MNTKSLYVLLSTLLCLQQVSGGVIARDNTTEDEQASSCSPSNGDTNLVARAADGEMDDCETLELYDEGIDQDELQQVKAGDFDGFTATTCSFIVAYVLKHYGSKAGGDISLGRRADEGDVADCQKARDILQGQKIPQPCQKIKNIEFGLNLANEYWGFGGEGTWDDIGGILEGKAGKAEFKIAEQPELGTSWWVPVKFPSDTIDISGIDQLSITADPHFWRWGQRDWFRVKDIRIRAQCADPGFEARNDKYVGISEWYRHDGDFIWEGPFTKKAVKTLPVQPGDWAFTPPCNVIKDLSYEFTLASGWGDGTGDKLTLALGDGKVDLGNSFDAGSTKKDTIDLKKTFNKDTIDIRDLKTVAIGDDNSGAGLFDRAWTLQGVTLSATCADVPKKMQMKKFASENKEVSHKDNAPAWTGNITPGDWAEVA